MTRPVRVGNIYGRLIVMAYSHRDGHEFWKCACECWADYVADGTALRQGRTVSCGCARREAIVARNRVGTHGATRNQQRSPEYRAWESARQRCNNPKDKDYQHYGGRGITVCKRWRKFSNFLQDMGARPPGTSIDREDVNGNYEPGNCSWATPKQQANNRRNNRRYKWAA